MSKIKGQGPTGHTYVHTVVDDHSRVAYAEIHADETHVRHSVTQVSSLLTMLVHLSAQLSILCLCPEPRV